MIRDIALLALACALMLVGVVSLIVYVVYTVRFRKIWSTIAAFFYVVGWLLSLIPLSVLYLYMPPWNIPLPGAGTQLTLDDLALIEFLFIPAAALTELISSLVRNRTTIKGLPSADGYVFMAMGAPNLFLIWPLNEIGNPLLRDLGEFPDYATQMLEFWWFTLIGMTVFIVVLALAARARYKESVRVAAEAAQASGG